MRMLFYDKQELEWRDDLGMDWVYKWKKPAIWLLNGALVEPPGDGEIPAGYELIEQEGEIEERFSDSNLHRLFPIYEKFGKTVGTELMFFLNTTCNEEDDKKEKLEQNIFLVAVDECVSIEPSDSKLTNLSLLERLQRYQNSAPLSFRVDGRSKNFALKYHSLPTSSGFSIVEDVESEDPKPLFYFELIRMVTNNIYMKKCEYCGKYFLIDGRRTTVKYCTTIPEGQTQTCFQLAGQKKYKDKLEKNPITRAYRSAYKKYNQRVRIGKWGAPQFEAWSSKAKEKLKQCEEGNLTDTEFYEWLKEDI